MLSYIDILFTDKFITLDDIICIGKPFGAQAYYLVWERLKLIANIEKLSSGVKHDEVPFVAFSEETMGNALGVASGIALTTTKNVWVNISDASLQMGNTLEAIGFIGHHQLKNIFLTVDYNNSQVTGKTSEILDVGPVTQLLINYSWDFHFVDGYDHKQIITVMNKLKRCRPTAVFFKTIKGFGVPEMELNPKKWHYRKLNEKDLALFLKSSEV
ncbi:MAG: hypothetical protein A2504_06950 [Bdellovibrionales bacterium RIFOXYD12_FULL_39_22]|nr:MAG: hypothetical protein A2385_05165 [Bdellovibrionales bacterium RIFOXYB1_FULL_39_21]OFZ44312.1 MAG: hypothetical protein A2485_15945 [Bdellovibrionales bacterium RIFOXYC12_FULL_39_17]OFZ49167.1 MAG: hypothetical protein A2404_15885 [Bdellovibrionales bacterium RIFOXYC1_FULL_39_130]OFZ72243.1 MAG: hypothetical protein A2451_15790 [Bdellovibrionales bacterium RIFOXYC2_FULL_39_8]OFZ76975.1 MAG: hypothetical protein A2560_10970 [Bdellovibrionales bacterium RIFOXYD1_FULL_39_84]OFZ95188.1 MAG: